MADDPNQQKPQDVPAAEAGEDGFGAAFAERSADPAGQAAKAQEDGQKPSDNEPAPKAGSEEAPAEKAATEQTASGKAAAFDPWDGMTPEQRSYWERKESSERSNRGRVGALTKKLNAFTIGTPAPTAAPKQDEKGEKVVTGTEEVAQTVADLDKELQAVAGEYPDVVGPVVKALEAVRDKIDKIELSTTTKAELEADTEAMTEAYGALERVHPDYAEVAADQNFAAWLGDQPPKVIELANSFDPREVSLAISLFKTERSAVTGQQPAGEGDQGEQGSTATDDKRKRQLEGSRQVPGKGQPTAAGVPNDFGSAFKARAEAHAKP